MSWIPRDLESLCAVHTTITNCQPSTLLFLQLIASIFGWSRDATTPRYNNEGAPAGEHGFTDFHNINFEHDFGGSFHSGHNEEYDFIVIGAGSAGCVVANRLTEVHDWNVLLLEAGDEEPEVAEVPAFAPMLQQSNIDWMYMTQPAEKSCLARVDGRCPWVRGKVMGGSSVLNYMIYTRGSPVDYDEWAASGNPGWKYKDVLPYFIKSEDNRDPDRIDSFYHGFNGYQTVEIFKYQDQNVWSLLDAFKELGLEEFDQNTERQIGASLLQHTTRDGERLSTNGAFIRPIRTIRHNLKIQTNAIVNRILIDPHTKTASGVEYSVNGKIKQVFAKKEVILSAGAINSPKILKLSGVGPSDELQHFSIPLIKELPVGFNLHDHTTMDGVLFAFTNKTSTIVDDYKQEADVDYYKQKRDGPLSATGSLQVNAFVQTQYATGDRADIQYSFDASNVDNLLEDPVLTAQTNVNPMSYYNGVQLRPVLLNPKSRGVVRLNETDPIYGDPLIYANTFSENIDLLTMIEGVKQGLNLIKTKALRKIGVQLVDIPWPACEQYSFGTDEYWGCMAMQYTATIYHPVGTCKMGPKNDKDAVVDAKLRVYGIKRLRVVDASIMPTIIRGNTNSVTIMIAEKASDLIKNAWTKGESYKYKDPYDVTEKNYH